MRSGIFTSEFWISAATIVGNLAGCVVGVVPPKVGAVVSGAVSLGYAIARGLAKIGR